ncbi:MAG TPA: DUF1801 domain-containing protein [Tahibacter sp.]|nr:DUF1801 domain-containing protein [Tahibacter sp.]
MSRRQPARVALDLHGLIGDDVLFRVPGGVARDAAVDAWLAAEPADLRAIARRWFGVMSACGDDVVELMHDGCPVACVGDAPFAYVNTFAHHVNVGFFRGASLDDPAGLLQGSGKRMRHVKLKPGAPCDDDALHALVRAAYADIAARLAAG